MKFANLVESCAFVTHEANRVLCESTGDDSQVPWEKAPEDLKKGTRQGVLEVLANPGITPEALHDEWAQKKVADGWVYGPKKDSDKKTHPNLVPFDQLSRIDQLKDQTFKLLTNETALAYMVNEARFLARQLRGRSVASFGTKVAWDGPDPSEFAAHLGVTLEAYAYGENDLQGTTLSQAKASLGKALPQIEKAFKHATRVRYRLTNASANSNKRVFYYIAPPFRTDYIVIDLHVKSPKEILLSMTWVPYEPGTTAVDVPNMILVKARPYQIAMFTGVYAIRLATELSRKMPNLL